MSAFKQFLARLQQRQDLVFVGLLMMTIGVMIIPIPPGLLDAIIALNISFTVTILLVAVYLDRATSFSTFPAVILIATTFRLSLAISTTRSVLSIADGGEIVRAFGHFVTGGNVAIGLVIFLIISIVQFIVVTKGAERVAEVAARFVLDALPGRQMSIDAELRSGDIDQDEARRRRQLIDKENQFFGAMDGAMKFVKGDAITGLLIVAVNLIGGLIIGVGQGHMSFAKAATTYSLLTIGDGLVSQIPALLIAMSAGIVITRVTTTDQTSDLGGDIIRDLTRSHRGLMVAGALIACLGLVPGFPTLIFLGLGGALGGFGYLRARAGTRAATLASTIAPEGLIVAGANDRIVARVGPRLANSLDPLRFADIQRERLGDHERRMGVALPRFGLLTDHRLADDAFSIDLDGVPLREGQIPDGMTLVNAQDSVLDLAGVTHQPAPAARHASHARWVALADLPALARAGLEPWNREAALVDFALEVMARHASTLIGFDVVQSMLRRLRAEYTELADQISSTVAPARILEILRRLVREEVPLRPERILFEAIAEWSPRQPDPEMLTEYVRRALSHQICHNLADSGRSLACYIVEPEMEQSLRGSVRQTENGGVLAPPAVQADLLLRQLGEIRPPLDPAAPRPVLLTSAELRRHLAGYLMSHDLDYSVIAFPEISREFAVHPVGMLTFAHAPPPMRAAA